jgi:predicted ATPase/DNA-binding SARP family transcriptional activator
VAGSARDLDIRLLGPIEVRRDAKVLAIGGRRQQHLLALLAIEAGRTIAADRLIEELRGDDPTESARGTLKVQVSRLRSALGAAAAIHGSTAGYTLDVDPGAVDAGRFGGLIGDARRFLARNPGRAAAAAASALGLWRGEPFGELAGDGVLAVEATRLAELRMEALELRLEADLRLGRSSELVAELEVLVAEHPHRERLWRQLMLALYRAGRQADALAAYHRARRALMRELGVEPGPELAELEAAILRQDVPFDAPADSGRGLPMPITSFVGRQGELADVGRLLARARLVTLTGVGGVGKTRLGLEAARTILDDLADGAWFVDLARLAAPELVAGEVAVALGVADEAGTQPTDRLVGYLREREALIVLDNCEHLVEACGALARVVLAQGPGVRILATSRVPLGVGGEVVYPVPPMSLSSDGAGGGVGRSEAAALFLERAIAANPAMAVERVDGEVVERICADLEGLPLALELAAARTRSLALPEIAGRLRDRFRFLVSWRRLATARHQTLREAMDWSYELLAPDARRVLDRLSVCAGGCDLAAATAICEMADDMVTLDAIERLLDASLVTPIRTPSGTSRYQLLETVREYGAARLAESGELAAARQAHARHYAALAVAAALPIRTGADGSEYLARLATERDNLRAALGWLRDAGDPVELLRVTEALWWYWWVRAEATEGRTWLTAAIAGAGGAAAAKEPGMRAAALLGLSGLAWSEGDFDAAASAAYEGEALFEKLHNDAECGRAWNFIGVIEGGRRDTTRAIMAFDRSIELYRAAADIAPEARARGLATALDNRASAALDRNDLVAAERGFEEARSVYAAQNPGKETAMYDLHLGTVAALQGRLREARPLLAQALEHYGSEGFLQYTTECLESIAWIANADGQHRDAATLLGAANRLRERTKTPMWGRSGERIDGQAAIARGALGEAAYEAAWEAGREDPEASVDLARRVLGAVHSA